MIVWNENDAHRSSYHQGPRNEIVFQPSLWWRITHTGLYEYEWSVTEEVNGPQKPPRRRRIHAAVLIRPVTSCYSQTATTTNHHTTSGRHNSFHTLKKRPTILSMRLLLYPVILVIFCLFVSYCASWTGRCWPTVESIANNPGYHCIRFINKTCLLDKVGEGYFIIIFQLIRICRVGR